jgi:magnesium transporter
MITAYLSTEKGLQPQAVTDLSLPDGAVWLDIVDITPDEEKMLEHRFCIDIPTRTEMRSIESSSRLYREDGALFLTATLLLKTETVAPEITEVTFIMVNQHLLTVRYAEPWSFRVFAQRAPKCGIHKASFAFLGLLETTIERLADMLEMISLQLEHVSQKTFRRPGSKGTELDLQQTLINLGTSGNILSKVRESLVDKNRLVIFIGQSHDNRLICPESRIQLEAIHRDLHSLSDQATFIASKISFLLDAVLGLINIEQNRTIKIFSVVAVLFMPPTLIASIYGMNFGDTRMPELSWKYGYEYAIGLMVASAAISIWYFKRQRWM